MRWKELLVRCGLHQKEHEAADALRQGTYRLGKLNEKGAATSYRVLTNPNQGVLEDDVDGKFLWIGDERNKPIALHVNIPEKCVGPLRYRASFEFYRDPAPKRGFWARLFRRG